MVPVLVKATARVTLLALIDLITCLCLNKKDLNCSTMNLIGIKHTGGKENKKYKNKSDLQLLYAAINKGLA